VKSYRDSAGFTRAVAVERVDTLQDDDSADVIDLVHLPHGTRPTPFAGLEYDEVQRCRVLTCGTYAACLAFAARLQWPSFHCRQCPKYAFVEGEAHEVDAIGADYGPDASVIKIR
jgi:hypothetical protein